MMVPFGISDDENSASGTCHQDFKIENPKIANAIHDDPKMENEDVNQREHAYVVIWSRENSNYV